MKMQNPVDVKLFLCEYVFDLTNLDTGGCKLSQTEELLSMPESTLSRQSAQ